MNSDFTLRRYEADHERLWLLPCRCGRYRLRAGDPEPGAEPLVALDLVDAEDVCNGTTGTDRGRASGNDAAPSRAGRPIEAQLASAEVAFGPRT